MQTTASIVVERKPGGYRDWMRPYKILVDGVASGSVKQGESVTVSVAPGTHSVQLKIDWCGSPTVAVEVPPSGQVALRCSPGGSAFTALWDMLRPGAYIKLEY